MAHQTAVDIIRVISEAVNPTGQFAYLRTWDASLEFNEVDQKIFLYPISGQVDITNGYFETWTCSMGFFFQDAPDSTNEQREQLITNADVLLKAFILAADTVDGVQFSIVRKRPVYRDMAGTYSGYLVDFTLSLTEDICNGDTPSVIIPVGKTFCELVDECLGISPSGSNTKYLNEKGLWTTPAGGGGGSVVIEATKAEFLALVTADDLTFPATYKITDIDNGLFVETLSANTFSPDATISLFVPNYTASGDNLGQMDFSSIPSVGVDEYIIWGDYYWINSTASPITPTITDDVTLAGGLTKLAKTSGSIYDILNLECVVDASLNIGSIYNASNDNTFAFSPPFAPFAPSVSYLNSPLSHPFIVSSNVTLLRNYKSGNPSIGAICNALSLRSPYRNNLIASNVGGIGLTISGDELNTVKENKGRFFDIVLEGSNNTFQGNTATLNNENVYNAIKLVNTSRFTGNKAVGGKSAFPNASNCGIGDIELFDNCQMVGNECNGESSVIWDVRAGENCQFDSNIINSNAVGVGNVGFNDIDQMQFDEINGNVLNGDDVIVEVINMLGYSKFNDNTFNGDYTNGNRWSGFQMLRSEITDNTFNANDIIWKDIWMSDAKLRNATDIQVQNCTFEGIDLDLTVFTTDIIGQTIQSGKGWFTYKRNLATSPILTTDTILHNIIPTGARITNLVVSGSANGNSIQIGLSGDDESLLVLPTSLLNNQLITVSDAASVNRSLLIKALTDPITTGEITVKCEFVC